MTRIAYGYLLNPCRAVLCAMKDKAIQITFPDGSIETYPAGIRVEQIAEGIGPRLARDALAGKVNAEAVDLDTPVDEDATVEIVTFSSDEGKSIYWHSTSHVMAAAVKALFPEAKLAIGPSTERGFYYDFDMPDALSEDDLERIEAKMRQIVRSDEPFRRTALSIGEARTFFLERGESYKVELIDELGDDEPVSLYHSGDFGDLCRGPHVPSVDRIRAFKLLSVAGAYWRGDERNKMLQRIYGVSFPRQKELDEHLAFLEEAKRRDHRVLGRDLDLFSTHAEVGAGLIHWHPKGAAVRAVIEDFWRAEHRDRGYDLVYTPHIASERIYEISGHLEAYADDMYSPMDIDGMPYRLKPMNCPAQILIYKSHLRSYRDLPIRYAELGTVYRYERSGVLQGMLRVRGFTQDDAHIFCRPDQLSDEINGVLDLVEFMMTTFGYTYRAYLATRPEKSIGSDEEWEQATEALRRALEDREMSYDIDPGGGVFYAPKIDIKLWDSLGREWQGPTVQVDLNLPERFDISYTGEDGAPHRSAMIHRTVLGSMERFIGGLIEHYAGAFPTWLAPVQVMILPVSDDFQDYGEEIERQLRAKGMRASASRTSAKLGYKIREAEVKKVPYMLIVGEKERAAQSVSVRRHRKGDIGALPLTTFESDILEEIEKRGAFDG